MRLSLRPPRLRTLLLLSNLAVLALPVAGLWALRLYESALIRQTESELVAQAAVLAGILREQLRPAPAPDQPPGPAAPTAAALALARRAGLDLATDPVLPPQPDDTPGTPADPAFTKLAEALTPVLRDAQAVTLASLRITDAAGTIVATTGADAGRNLSGWAEVARVLGGEALAAGMHRRDPAQTVPGGISRTAGLRVFVALPVDDGAGRLVGAVVLSRTPNTLGGAIWGKRWPLAGLALLLLGGGALLAAGISRLVTRPLGMVVAQARAVAGGGSMAALARPGTREVAMLSDALARMAATLAQRAGYISGFAASVSHEFKTPMAAIRAAAELLEDHGADLSAAERTRLSRLVVEGVARLDRLVGRLLDLARADMMRVAPRAGTGVAVAPLLHRVAARFRAEGVAVEADEAPGLAWIGEDALEAVLGALVENAARHAPGARVRLSGRVEQGCVQVAVADDGPGIPPAHRDLAFQPFFTTARDRGGTGLGLPIVRALLSGVGGTAALLPTEAGTTLVITLPEWRDGQDAAAAPGMSGATNRR